MDDAELIAATARGHADALAVLYRRHPPRVVGFALRVVDERAYQEIAGELECSGSVVRQRVSRGLARARARLSTRANTEDRP